MVRNLNHKELDKHDQQHVQLMYQHKLTEVVSVPADMTHFFQLLDLTVNREARYVGLRLSILKPIQATWLVSSTTICLALKADSQLQKDGRRLAKLMLSVAPRNFHQNIPLKTWMFRNIADSRTICT